MLQMSESQEKNMNNRNQFNQFLLSQIVITKVILWPFHIFQYNTANIELMNSYEISTGKLLGEKEGTKFNFSGHLFVSSKIFLRRSKVIFFKKKKKNSEYVHGELWLMEGEA